MASEDIINDDLLTEDEVFLPADDVEVDLPADEVDVDLPADEVDDAPPSRLEAARTVVFTTVTLLSLLCVASHVHIDGTFKVSL